MCEGGPKYGLLLPALCARSSARYQARISAQVERKLSLPSGIDSIVQSRELFHFIDPSSHFNNTCPPLQNLLRNAAKSGCQTNYTYIPDIDMVPYPTMDLQLEQFLATEEVSFCCSQQCLPVSQGEGLWDVCLCGAHL